MYAVFGKLAKTDKNGDFDRIEQIDTFWLYFVIPPASKKCQQGCPKKIPPKNNKSSSVQICSRKKRKLQAQLDEAENSVFCPPSRIVSLRRKIAIAHINIRDAINEDLLFREQKAVDKLKSNPKYF